VANCSIQLYQFAEKSFRHVCALSVARGGRKLGILTERAKSVKGMPHITEPLLDAFERATLRLRHSNVRTEAQWRLNRSGWRQKRPPPSPFLSSLSNPRYRCSRTTPISPHAPSPVCSARPIT